MTAVLDEPQISAPPKTVIFAARREDLRLTKIPRYPVMGASGQKVDETKGEVVCFRQGRLEVPLEGDFTLEDGRTTDAAEVLAWLAKHRLNGDTSEGFFKVELTAPAPTQEEMDALVDAAMALDVDRLREIVRQEEEGWGREAVLSVARRGVDKIEEFKAEHAAAEDAKEAAAKPKGKLPAGEAQKD